MVFSFWIQPNLLTVTKKVALLADLSLWHHLLARVHADAIRTMVENGVVKGIDTDTKQNVSISSDCISGKATSAKVRQEGRERNESV